MFRVILARQLMAIFILFFLGLLWIKPAQSQGIPVVDASNLAQAIQDAINQGTQISNQAAQIQNQIQTIQNQVRTLQTLGSGNFNQLDSNFNQQLSEIQTILNSTQTVGYTLETVKTQFDELFPKGTDWENIDWSKFRDFYRDWNASISESARTAMEAQASLGQVQRHNNAARNILASVQGADGEVRQLQANNQLLSVLSQQMSGLNQAMMTSGRVTATMAAKSVAQEQAKQEAAARSRRDYTDRGDPVPVPTSLPGR